MQSCRKYQQENYRNKACLPKVNTDIVRFLREGVGIRGLGRLAGISVTTVISRIKTIASQIKEPTLPMGKTYEVDELCTYVKYKGRKVWVVCALEKATEKIVRFSVGTRSNKTLKRVLISLRLSAAKRVYTDKLKNYSYLIEKHIHRSIRYGTNHIERMNLTLRTHLKRLQRRTICYSKSGPMLENVLKIYLWG